jgi:hypothetical protein
MKPVKYVSGREDKKQKCPIIEAQKILLGPYYKCSIISLIKTEAEKAFRQRF